jgi:hypothetical protein
VAIGRKWCSSHDLIYWSEKLDNVNGGVSIDERVAVEPSERCNGDAALVNVLRTEMDDEEELALRVEAGSEGK